MWITALALASAPPCWSSSAFRRKKSPKVSPRPPIRPTYRNSRRETRRKCDGSSYQVIGLNSLIVFLLGSGFCCLRGGTAKVVTTARRMRQTGRGLRGLQQDSPSKADVSAALILQIVQPWRLGKVAGKWAGQEETA